jgi:hypothetical protein
MYCLIYIRKNGTVVTVIGPGSYESCYRHGLKWIYNEGRSLNDVDMALFREYGSYTDADGDKILIRNMHSF